jgi:ethanolamine utilization protein EutN
VWYGKINRLVERKLAMILGKVIGTVVSTRKDDALIGYKLLIVEVQNPMTGKATEALVAVDTVGAGIGEEVLVATGSAARAMIAETAPIDAAVIGIIDTVDY